MTQVALFPIPNCVTFPGMVFPLHVFEPRYRHMVQHCLDTHMPLGICHTQKVVREAKDNQSLDEALQSNQATYKPFDLFSAGRCELLKVLDDGRMYLNVYIEKRFRLLKEIQNLPFSIAECEAYGDQTLTEAERAEAELTQEKILHRLQVMTSNLPSIQEQLMGDDWINKDVDQFSFEIFSILQFDANMQQNVLEMTSARQRLNYLLSLLNSQH